MGGAVLLRGLEEQADGDWTYSTDRSDQCSFWTLDVCTMFNSVSFLPV